MGYMITRQRYYDTNQLAVEIACGGPKKAGIDVLPFKYGEGRNLVSPIDSVNVALSVFRQWQTQYHDEPKKLCIVDSKFKEGRKFFEFDKRGIDAAMKWAEAEAKSMDSCANCHKLIGSTSTPIDSDEMPNKLWCNEACYATTYRHVFGVEAPPKQKKAKK